MIIEYMLELYNPEPLPLGLLSVKYRNGGFLFHFLGKPKIQRTKTNTIFVLYLNHLSNKLMKTWKYIIIPLLVLLSICGAQYSGYKSSPFEKKEEENSTVLLSRIERVMKLVTIEGHVSEMYGYKDHHSFDFGIFRILFYTPVLGKAVDF